MAIVQLTNAGAALLEGGSGPITLSTYQLGSAVNYTPEPTDTAIHGSLILQGSPSLPVAVSANVVKYGVYLDYGTGPYTFGELGLFTSDGTLFALVAWNQLITKLPVGPSSPGQSMRIDIYLSMVGQNYAMWLNLAESNNAFKAAVLSSPDVLPQPQQATPNMFIISGLAADQSAFLAYTDQNGLWNFDAYAFASQSSATITSFDDQSVTIALSDFVSDMSPAYLGQVILEFSTGNLYGTCRYVSSAITSGSHVTLGFDNPVMLLPQVGDKVQVVVRQELTTTIPVPIASPTVLGGVIIGTGLTVQTNGLLSVNYSTIPYPVTTVAGRTGAIVLEAADIGGLATVATSGSYNDLINKPAAYTLPIASTSVLGGVKAPSDGNITISGAGVIDLGFTPVTSVNGQSGAVTVPAYTLPVATATVLGGVKQGANVTIAGDGTLSVAAPYVLPIASASVLGGVKQGANITIAGDGTISTTAAYTLPVATATVLGGVKQGSNVTIAGDGTLSVAAPYTLPVASASVLGGVKQGTNVTIAGDGTLSVSGVVTSVSGQTGVVVVNAVNNNGATGTSLISDGGSTTGTIKLKTLVAGLNVTFSADVNGNLVMTGNPGGFSGFQAIQSATNTITTSEQNWAFQWFGNTGSATMPLAASVPLASSILFYNQGTGNLTIVPAGTDKFNVNLVSSLVIPPGTFAWFISRQSTEWDAFGTYSLAAGGVTSVSGQTGAVVVQASDNNPATGTSLISNSGATTANVKLKTLVGGTNVTLAADGNGNIIINGAATGVTTFNTRSGSVTLIGSDVTGAGGALLTDVAASKYYDLQGGSAGTLTASQILMQHVAVRALTVPASMGGSQGYAGTTPTGAITLQVSVLTPGGSSTNVGTINWAASGITPTFTSGGFAVAAGQVVIVTAPASADATFANVSFTILGLAT